MLAFCVVLLAWLVAATVAADVDINNDLIFREVSRGIDLTTNLARHKVSITVNNGGAKETLYVHLIVDKAMEQSMAFISVKTSSGEPLVVDKVQGHVKSFPDFAVYRVTLAEALKAQATAKFVVRMVFVDVQQPHPAAISQNDVQLVRYTDNHYYAAAYATTSQRTSLKLGSSAVESFSQLQPTTRKGAEIIYGSYDDVAAFSSSPLSVHFENNAPFIKAVRATKEIEISHWGNAAVEMQYDLLHAGARLKGVFSRYEFQRNPAGAKPAVRQLKLDLPPGAADIYYRDEIGNISTSTVAPASDAVGLTLVPRYVLFGGWRASFCVGYNLPLANVLQRDVRDADLYMLNVTFFADWKAPVPVDQYELSVVLPEGAVDIQLHAPFAVDAQALDLRFTYLDTTGRPCLRVKKAHVVGDHDRAIQITYRFASRHMLHEPLLLSGVMFAFCLAVIAYTRSSFKIGDAKATPRSATRLGECIARLRDVCERRDRFHAALDDALAKFAKTRNRAQFDAERAAVVDGFDECTRDAMRLAAEIESLDARRGAAARQVDAADRARQAAHLDIAQHEGAPRAAQAAPDAAHDAKRAELDRRYSAADDAVERLASLLLD